MLPKINQFYYKIRNKIFRLNPLYTKLFFADIIEKNIFMFKHSVTKLSLTLLLFVNNLNKLYIYYVKIMFKNILSISQGVCV